VGARQRRRTWHSRIPPPAARACLPSAMRCTHRPAPLACPCALPMTRCGGTGGGSRSNVSAGGAAASGPAADAPAGADAEPSSVQDAGHRMGARDCDALP
jgi:hypothetical protein